jgi:hypothetical protein
MEVEPRANQLWVLDQGRVMGAPAAPGSIRLLVFSLATDAVVREYAFPPALADPAHSFLNDVVLDPPRGAA